MSKLLILLGLIFSVVFPLVAIGQDTIIYDSLMVKVIDDKYLLFEREDSNPFTGVAIRKNDKGNLIESVNINKGQSFGFAVKYFENGKIREKVRLKENDVRHGCYFEYDSLGNVTQCGKYFDDLKHGPWYIAINNNVVLSGYYLNGLETDIWRYYDEVDGHLFQQSIFKNGILIRNEPIKDYNKLKSFKVPDENVMCN